MLDETSLLTVHDIEIVQLRLEISPALAEPTALGIDPGQVHMGLAFLNGESARLYEIKIPSFQDSIERIMAITEAVQFILAGLPKPQVGCVEGAAYMAAYGQVPLETARTTSAIALLQAGVWPVYVSPPFAIRKHVFGDGKLRAQTVWPNMPPNAVSALACAWYARLKLLAKGD